MIYFSVHLVKHWALSLYSHHLYTHIYLYIYILNTWVSKINVKNVTKIIFFFHLHAINKMYVMTPITIKNQSTNTNFEDHVVDHELLIDQERLRNAFSSSYQLIFFFWSKLRNKHTVIRFHIIYQKPNWHFRKIYRSKY